MRRVVLLIAVIALAGLIGAPAALAEPTPKIDWSELLGGIVGENLEVGEEMC